jgi:hypothetical protein
MAAAAAAKRSSDRRSRAPSSTLPAPFCTNKIAVFSRRMTDVFFRHQGQTGDVAT